MKWAVIILVVLGLLAAGSTAVLFGWVQAKNANSGSKLAPAVEVLVAQGDWPARTRLVAEQVKIEPVPREGLPVGYFTNQAQAIGKTLKVAVVKGQPLTVSHFFPETAIDELLRPGMLAFQISQGRRSTAVDLFYPGCVVDVFATFPLQDRKKGEAVTTPLLQNIQVLAVRDETVISAAEEKDKNGTILPRRSPPRGGDVTVALEVTSRQAAALQLAMERGTLGLAMRNPLDKSLNPMEPMVVKEGQLTASSEAMDPQTLALVNQLQALLGNKPLPDANSPTAVGAAANASPAAAASLPEYFGKQSAWLVTVIRGQKVEETELKLSEGQGEEAQPSRAKTPEPQVQADQK